MGLSCGSPMRCPTTQRRSRCKPRPTWSSGALTPVRRDHGEDGVQVVWSVKPLGRGVSHCSRTPAPAMSESRKGLHVRCGVLERAASVKQSGDTLSTGLAMGRCRMPAHDGERRRSSGPLAGDRVMGGNWLTVNLALAMACSVPFGAFRPSIYEGGESCDDIISLLVLATIAASLAVLTPAAASAHGWYDVPTGARVLRGTQLDGAGQWLGSWGIFRLPCRLDTHDLCYVYAWYYGRTDQGRQACDVQFYNNMARWCQNRYPWTYWWTRCTAGRRSTTRGAGLWPYFYKPDAISRRTCGSGDELVGAWLEDRATLAQPARRSGAPPRSLKTSEFR